MGDLSPHTLLPDFPFLRGCVELEPELARAPQGI